MAKKQTYAARAKTIMNRYKPRLGEKFDNGDSLSLEAMNQELTALQQEQEQARAVQQQKDQQFEETAVQTFANGGKLNKRQQQTLSTILANRNTPFGQQGFQEQGLFAKGGTLPRYQIGGTFNAQNYDFPQLDTPINYLNPQTGAFTNIPGAQQQPGGGVGYGDRVSLAQNQDFNTLQAANQSPANLQFDPITSLGQYQDQASFGAFDDPSGFLASQGLTGQNSLTGKVSQTDTGDDFTPFKSRVPYFGAVAQGLGSVLANRKIDFGDQTLTAQQVQPQTVDFSREREQFQRDRDIAQSQIRRSASQTGSQAQAMQNIITGATGTQRALGRQTSKSLQGEENINAQIRNQASQFNATQRARTAGLNLRRERENLLINEQRRSGRIQGVAGAITGYGKDRVAADQYDQMLSIMAPENYQLGQDQDSALRRLLQISPTMKRQFQRGTATLSN